MVSFYIKTYGCQANVADTEGLARYLLELSCQQVSTAESADLILINTCAIRDKAEQKLYSYIGQLAAQKKIKPYLKIGILGCVASYRKKEIYQSFDHISFVYGAREEHSVLQGYLADAIEKINTLKMQYEQDPFCDIRSKNKQDRDIKKISDRRSLSNVLRFPASLNISEFNLKKHLTDGLGSFTKKHDEIKRSFINIMTGCNKYCSYCIVPFTRGREISYNMHEIVTAVTKDVAMGSREVTLIGQNVNSYIDPTTGDRFPELLACIAQLPGNFWIRFMSPHPQDMTRDLFDVMVAYRPKITAAIHFPVQSGSDKILQAMNRNYTIAEYKEKIGWIRTMLPGATISTDIIVGFPGETEAEFLETMQLIEHVRFDLIYSFIYSSRRHTRASSMVDDCPAAEKTRRLDFLQKRQIEIAATLNSSLIGNKIKVLVEKRLAHGKLLSRTEGNIRVILDGSDDLIGQFVDVQIESAGPANMKAVHVV